MPRLLLLGGPFALSGCAQLFDLRELPAVAAPDASACDELVHDEDLDLIDDRCDNCPGVANPEQVAANDDDPVGDACDPDPFASDYMLERFHSFADPDAPLEWVGVAGNWKVETDLLTYTAPSQNHVAVTYRGGDIIPPAAFELAFQVDALPPAGTYGAIRVFPNGNAQGNVGAYCVLYQPAGVSPNKLVAWDETMSMAGPGADVPLDLGARYRLVVELRTDELRCALTDIAAANRQIGASRRALATVPTGTFAISSHSIALTVEYIAHYSAFTSE